MKCQECHCESSSRDQRGRWLCHPCRHGEMSLRDRFAAAALTGMLANPKIERPSSDFVEGSYAVADLMMDERKKPRGPALPDDMPNRDATKDKG